MTTYTITESTLYSSLNAVEDDDIVLNGGGTCVLTIDENTAALASVTSASSNNTGGHIVINDDCALNVKGAVDVCRDWVSALWRTITLGAGSSINRIGTSTDRCACAGYNGGGNRGRFIINGTSSNPSVINGAGYMPVGHAQGYDGVTKSGVEGEGYIEFVNVPETRLAAGGATAESMSFDADCGTYYINGTYLGSEDLEIGAISHAKAGAVNIDISNMAAGTTRTVSKARLAGRVSHSGDTLITWNDFYAYAVDAPGAGNAGDFVDSWLCFERDSYTFRPQYTTGGVAMDYIAAGANPHWFGGISAQRVSGVVFGSYVLPITSDSGNCIMPPVDTYGTVIVDGCIVPYQHWVSFLSLFGYSGLKVLAHNCTILNTNNEAPIQLGETTEIYANTLRFYNMLLAGGDTLCDVYGDGSNADDDCVDDADYNCTVNAGVDPYSLLSVARIYASAPGANDTNTDPLFTDADADYISCAASFGSTEVTLADAIDWLEAAILADTISPADVRDYFETAYTPSVSLPGKSGVDAAVTSFIGESVDFPGYIGAVEPVIPSTPSETTIPGRPLAYITRHGYYPGV